MTAMPSIPGGLTWDPQDRLIETDLSGGGVVYYVYDSAGMRVRKVWVNQSGTTSKERYYLGAWETYRETADLLGTPTLDLERETLHVDDAAGAACLIETKTVESATPIGSPDSVLRYNPGMSLADIERGVIQVLGEGTSQEGPFIDNDARTLLLHELYHAKDYVTGKWNDGKKGQESRKQYETETSAWEKENILKLIKHREEGQAIDAEREFRRWNGAPLRRRNETKGILRPEHERFNHRNGAS
jgi:YD repeat-containing protein